MARDVVPPHVRQRWEWRPSDHLRSVTVRPVRDDDGDRLGRFFARLSQETVYRRFFSPLPRLSGGTLRRFLDVDHHDHEALVAMVRDEVVGVAGFDALTAPTATRVAEAAIVVEDEWQRRGIGRFLMFRLGIRAWEEGITSFDATVLATNDAPIKLARAVAPVVRVEFDGTETQLHIPLGRVKRDRHGESRGAGSPTVAAWPTPTGA